jgi:signal transduction histidine kinase
MRRMMGRVGLTMTHDVRAAGPQEPPMRTSIRLVWLTGLVYAVAAATRPGVTGRHLAASVLTATTAIGWGLWLVARHRHWLTASLVSIVMLVSTGGALVVIHPIGVAVVGIAAMCAASLLDLIPAAALTAPGIVAAAIAVAVSGSSSDVIASAASGAAAGLALGMGRRQGQQRVRQELELSMAHQRTELEHERAEVFAERNRLAREVHDVLAHTLSALSVQMEALGSLVDDKADVAEIGEVAARSRRLVTEGLEETRRAVRLLRDQPIDLAEQLATLADEGGVVVQIDGEPRQLSAAAGLAFVRVAQEAVTNARKHASGAPVNITLAFHAESTQLTVENLQTAASLLAATGAGYGLQGMRERIELIGGSLSAGPVGNHWRVDAEAPA